jgi:hypothetical protein
MQPVRGRSTEPAADTEKPSETADPALEAATRGVTVWPWDPLPESVVGLLQHGLPAAADDMINAIRSEVPEYARPQDAAFLDTVRQGVTVALDRFVDIVVHRSDVPDLGVYFALGRLQVREGRTIDALQSAYRVGARVAWRHVVAGGEAAGTEPVTLYRLAEAIFAYIDRLADASVAGYAQELSAQAGAAQARRHLLVALLARRPPAAPSEVERAATQAGWPLPRTLAALAVGDADAVNVARRLPPGALGAALDPVAVVLLPDPDAPGRRAQVEIALAGQRAVLGPTVPWSHAYQSISRAVGAWPLHARGGLGQQLIAHTEEHLLTLLLAADPALVHDLAARRLRPLERLPEGARERAEATLRAWFDAHGDVSAAAKRLHVHPQTVRYRLAGLRDVFGRALDDPATRLETELALRSVRPPAARQR